MPRCSRDARCGWPPAVLPLLRIASLGVAVGVAGMPSREATVLRHTGILPGTPGNHNPSFQRGPDITTIEDVGIYDFGRPWAVDVCDGEGAVIHDPNRGMTAPFASRCPSSGVQTLTFTVDCERKNLFTTQPTVTPCTTAGCNCDPMVAVMPPTNCAGALRFEAAPDACGTTKCTISVRDGGERQCVEEINQQSCPCPGCCQGLDCDPANAMLGACPGPNTQVPFLCPSGCEPADCSQSITETFSITLTCVNDAPSFSCRGSGATSGAQAVLKGDTTQRVTDFFFNIDKCANCAVDNEEGQGVRFVIDADNKGLFQVQPRVAWDPSDPATADLLYDPKPCEFGTATVTVTMYDDGGVSDGGNDVAPATCAFQIEIKDKNTAPSFDLGACPIVIDEDAPAFSRDTFATRISKGCETGSGEESRQTLTFNTALVDPQDAGLFRVLPSIDPLTGRLSFETQPDVNTLGRNVEFYMQLCDDALLKDTTRGTVLCTCNPITNCPKCTIEIRPINDLPSFTAGSDVLVSEDLCQLAVPPVPLTHTIANWATDISVGSNYEGIVVQNNPNVFNPEGQRPYFVVTTTDDSIYAAGGGPTVDETGTLTFTLAPHANGVSDVRVTIKDTGPPQNEGNTAVFRITAQAVNDPPTFDLDVKGNPGPLDVVEGAGPLEFDSWLSRISKGPDDELSQQLTLRTFVQNPSCFKIQPEHSFTATTSARLSFAPVDNVPMGVTCVSQVTVYVKDDGLDLRCNKMGGCTCGDETEATFTIRVLDGNDPPSFVKGPDINIQEDAFPGGFTQVGWATSISAGPNEGPPAPQSVLFVVATNNDALFAAGRLPTIDPTTGTLQFTAAQDACGTAVVSVYAEDNGVPVLRSPVQTFTVSVACCNDPPEFTLGPDLIGTAVVECSTVSECPRQFPGFVTGIRPGPVSATDEVTQRVTFFLEGFDASLFEGTAGQPKINEFGTLSFTPKVGVNTPLPFSVTVRATDDGKVAAGCVSTASKTFQMQITPNNNAPTFTHGGNVQVLEDTVGDFPAWARSISAGPEDEAAQVLTFTLTPADPTLFSVQPAVNAMTGRLTFTPAPDAFGRTEVRVTLDDGQAVNSQRVETITITIVGVNDRPSFTVPQEISVLEDSPQYLKQYALSISKGAANEASQTLRFVITGVTDPSLFSVQPSVAPDGVMSFLLKPDVSGEATFTVRAVDDGGTAHNGEDTSASATTVIKVTSVNDPPTFKAMGDITGVLEDSGAFSRAAYITGVTPGADNEASQSVRFELSPDNTALFVEPPAVDQFGTLTFRPAEDAFGSTAVRISAIDTGPGEGDGRGGGLPDRRTSDYVFFTIAITPVNDAPLFALDAPVVVTEDAPAVTVPNWARQVSVGAANEAALQQLTWRAIPRDTTLFATQPAMVQQGMSQCSGACTADLQFTPAANANGATEVEVCLSDTGGTLYGGVDKTCVTTTITITPVDDPPIITVATTEVVVLEDSGLHRRENWLQSVVPGPRDELNQLIASVSIRAAPGEELALQQLLTGVPVVERHPNGPLVFTPLEDQNGKVNLFVVASDNGAAGGNTAELPFSISVAEVNDPPVFTGGGDVANVQNTGVFSQRWATGISAGPPNEAAQALSFEVSVGDPGLFSVQPRIDAASGVLTFSPGGDRIGKTTAKAVLKDNGGTANGGVDTSQEVVFSITVFPRNSRPLWYKGPDITVLEDSGGYSRPWATNISAGGVTDIGQKLSFVTTATPDDVLVNPPSIDPNGVLTFVPNTNRYGVVTVRAVLSDDGGVLNGGVSSSLEQTFVITVIPVNDAPSFTAGPDIALLEDAPQQVVSKWLRGATPGPFEDGQTLSFYTTVTDRPELFSELPRISSITSDITFTPALNANGEATVRIIAKDSGGTTNGGRDESEPYVLRIRIAPVNDAPSFTPGVDVAVQEDQPPATVALWASNIAAGPADESAQTLSFKLSNNNPRMFGVAPQISPQGDLTFTLASNANGVAQVTATLQDSGGTANGGVDTTSPATFRITAQGIDDPPGFTRGATLINVEPTDAYQEQWATGISGGPADENQNVRFQVTNDNPGLFAVQPAVSPTGLLSFTVSSAGIGVASVSVVAYDAGGNPSAVQTLQVVADTSATAVRSLVTTTLPAAQFNGGAFAESVCAMLGVPSDRCATTLVTDATNGVEVQVEFQPRPASRPSEPTANELAKQYLRLSPTQQAGALGIVNARPVPAIGVAAPAGCGRFTTRPTCVAPCVWDDSLGVCTESLSPDSGGGLSTLALVLIILACLAVVLCLAALTHYCLAARKRRQEEEAAALRKRYDADPPDSDLYSPRAQGHKFAQPPPEELAEGPAPANPLTNLYATPEQVPPTGAYG